MKAEMTPAKHVNVEDAMEAEMTPAAKYVNVSGDGGEMVRQRHNLLRVCSLDVCMKSKLATLVS
jgi:hypothetical protein